MGKSLKIGRSMASNWRNRMVFAKIKMQYRTNPTNSAEGDILLIVSGICPVSIWRKSTKLMQIATNNAITNLET